MKDKKIIRVLLPVLLICLLMPQKVQAATIISVVNNGDLSITASVDFSGYDGYVAYYLTEADYMRFSALNIPADGTACLMGVNMETTNSTVIAGYSELWSGTGPAFAEGDVVYAVICLVKYEDYLTYGFQYVVYGIASTTIIIESSHQPAAANNHSHSYQWVTVTEASLSQDGMEQYACACGDVQITQPISAATAYVKGLYGAVKDAAQDGTIDYNTGKWTGINDYVIRKLAERSDVTTKITFEYKNVFYTFTIPAGTSYETLLSNEEHYYGFFTFCKLLGIPVTQL